MGGTQAPDGQNGGAHDGNAQELVVFSRSLIPTLRERAARAWDLRRLPDETIADIEDAGLLRFAMPPRFGGVQGSHEQLAEVLTNLALGCGSTSWTVGIYMTAPHFLSVMSDEAQEEVFSKPGARACVSFLPTGKAVACPGGYTVSGQWRFCSGQHHAQFALLSTFAQSADGADLGPAQMIVPRSQLELVDDWDVSGLRGSGSNSLIARDVFVPAHLGVLLAEVDEAKASKLRVTDPYYQIPLIPLFSSLSPYTPLGMAIAALEIFSERVQKRGITYTEYGRQADATVTQLQMAEAHMKLDQAKFHAERQQRDTIAMQGYSGTLLERARCRADMAWSVKLSREVAEIVQNASGASSISNSDPLRRIIQDLEALSLHSFILHSTNAELYGRVLCGKDPGVVYI
ncbi:acyl-CoA dehydrogenase family protein [Sphingobium sp.]|uniref:acyl-CoA dehydrogenase family protein n=1 Tax=Sphingobium sp. TaxID=1912891 RepID=UPI0028BE500A|nr:acyl-CoA dehydrogenase family protein [Sphingobium sp.]